MGRAPHLIASKGLILGKPFSPDPVLAALAATTALRALGAPGLCLGVLHGAAFAQATGDWLLGAPGLCLGVLHGWEIVRTTKSRQVAGTWTLRDLIRIVNDHKKTFS